MVDQCEAGECLDDDDAKLLESRVDCDEVLVAPSLSLIGDIDHCRANSAPASGSISVPGRRNCANARDQQVGAYRRYNALRAHHLVKF